MRDVIRQILQEEVQRKYNRLTPDQYEKIYKLFSTIFKNFKLEWRTKVVDSDYVGLKFCRGGHVVAKFSADDDTKGKPHTSLMVDNTIVNQVQSVFNIRRTLVLHLISEFFEDTYLNDVSRNLGTQLNGIEDAVEHNFKNWLCDYVLDDGKPDFKTRDEKLNWIQSTGRGRRYWESKSDEELDRDFDDIWRIDKQAELNG